jgi:hypothetical protein
MTQVSDVTPGPVVCFYPVTFPEQILLHMNIKVRLANKGAQLVSIGMPTDILYIMSF